MKRAFFIAATLLAFASCLHAQSSDTTLYTYDTLKSANGEQIFHAICQGCHMPDAKGAIGAGAYPALANNPKLASPQYMTAVVLFGRHDMPSFGTKPATHGNFFRDAMLTDEQVADVVNYVRTHFGNHYTNSITAAEVAAMHPQTTASTPTSH
ncbi:cytochrome c [Dyella sp. 2HG41-7]|uniref:c-type cytochrome n=1 Tax=Dyella sp. 2HG41-7 TaxID=2883239 RepID=UPI001F282BF1|nr:cytochrome c [Dyella sp. 2HG41-7]